MYILYGFCLFIMSINVVIIMSFLFFFFIGSEQGYDDFGVLDNFDIGDDLSCNIKIILEGKLLSIYIII